MKSKRCGKVKLALSILLCSLSIGASGAHALIIDPDFYAQGTNLSAISPYVSLAISDGTPQGSPAYAYPYSPPDGATAGPLGSRTFGEFCGYPLYPPFTDGALVITFLQPVSYLSILSASVNPWSPPVAMWIYDSSGVFVSDQYRVGEIVYNGLFDYGDGMVPAFPVSLLEFSGPDIGRVVISGESEFTVLDRITFTVEPIPIPEPSTLLLLCMVVIGMAYVGWRGGHS